MHCESHAGHIERSGQRRSEELAHEPANQWRVAIADVRASRWKGECDVVQHADANIKPVRARAHMQTCSARPQQTRVESCATQECDTGSAGVLARRERDGGILAQAGDHPFGHMRSQQRRSVKHALPDAGLDLSYNQFWTGKRQPSNRGMRVRYDGKSQGGHSSRVAHARTQSRLDKKKKRKKNSEQARKKKSIVQIASPEPAFAPYRVP